MGKGFYACLFLILVQYGFSQSQYGALKGRIIDDKGKPIKYSAIDFVRDDVFVFGISTNENGEYLIDSIPYGKYSINIHRTDYMAHNPQVLPFRNLITEQSAACIDTSLIVNIDKPIFEQNLTLRWNWNLNLDLESDLEFCLYLYSPSAKIDDNIRPLRRFISTPIYVVKKDTLYYYLMNNRNDSIVFSEKGTKISRNKWIFYSNDGSYSISKYKKIKPSQLFKEKNSIYFHADYECKQKGTSKSYDKDGNLKLKSVYFFSFVRHKKIKPKK